MELINFSIGDDHVSLWYGDQRHDLHNNYEFQKLVFDPNGQTLELYWSPGIKLSFAGVYLLKARQRDPEMPLVLLFMSDFSIKVGANSARMEVVAI